MVFSLIVLSVTIFIAQTVLILWLGPSVEGPLLPAAVAALGLLPAVLWILYALRLFRKVRRAHVMLRTLEKAAHDLKSPLISLGIYLDKMQAQIADTDQREKWLWVFKQIEWLKYIVQQTLDYRLLRMGRLETNFQSVPLRNLAQEVWDLLAILYSGLEERLRVTGEDVVVKTDPVKIKQVLFNLLNNAIRYTTGSIHLSWSTIEGKGVRVTVADEGPGLPSDRSFQGHGLGLEITAALLRSCHSRLIRDPVPKGVSWSFELDLAEGERGGEWASRSWKMVLVEDDPVYAALFLERARRYTEVWHVSDPYKLGALLRQDAFDAVICDYHLKKLKGPDLPSLLRSEGVQTPPFVFITSQVNFEVGDDVIPGGAGIYSKPLAPSEFDFFFENALRVLQESANARRLENSGNTTH